MRLSELKLKPRGKLELTELEHVDEDVLIHAVKQERYALTFHGGSVFTMLDELAFQHVYPEAEETYAHNVEGDEGAPQLHEKWFYYKTLFYRPADKYVYGDYLLRCTFTSDSGKGSVRIPTGLKFITDKQVEKVHPAIAQRDGDIDLTNVYPELIERTPS